jgi:hypothetical protein
MSRISFASQYGCCCVVIEHGDTAQDVIDRAWADEATYNDGEGDLFCVQFADRPQELFTEQALRESMAHGHR